MSRGAIFTWLDCEHININNRAVTTGVFIPRCDVWSGCNEIKSPFSCFVPFCFLLSAGSLKDEKHGCSSSKPSCHTEAIPNISFILAIVLQLVTFNVLIAGKRSQQNHVIYPFSLYCRDLSARMRSLVKKCVWKLWDMVCYTVHCVKICLFHILKDLW